MIAVVVSRDACVVVRFSRFGRKREKDQNGAPKCCFAQSPEPFRWRQMLGTIFVDFCGETVDVVCLPTGDNGGVKRQIVQAKDLL